MTLDPARFMKGFKHMTAQAAQVVRDDDDGQGLDGMLQNGLASSGFVHAGQEFEVLILKPQVLFLQ